MKRILPFLSLSIFFFLQIPLSFSQTLLPENVLRVHFFDVGYGDAILVQLPEDQAVLVDTGTEGSQRKLVDDLKALGIKDIRTLIITHPHDNHYGGIPGLLGQFSIGRVFINGDGMDDPEYQEILDAVKNREIPIQILKRGDTISDLPLGITADVLNPSELTGSTNANSLVVWLKYNQRSILLTGDVKPKKFNKILDLYTEVQEADCILIPHHGRTLTDQLVETFKNKIFMVSTGPNEYGEMPVEEWSRLKGAVFITESHGNIVYETDGINFNVQAEKNESQVAP